MPKKIRIAIYYDNITTGRNDGNPLYVCAALRRIEIYGKKLAGIAVDHAHEKAWMLHEDPVLKIGAEKLFANNGTYIEVDHLAPYEQLSHDLVHDFHFWIDWGEDALTPILPYPIVDCKKPMVYWASDTHLGYEYRLSMAKKADFVFAAQPKAVEDFERDGIKNPILLPHAVEPSAYPKNIIATKRHDVCFVGNVNSENRTDALDRLFREFPNFFWGQRRFEEAAQKYGESKIAFNISMKGDINMRCFEIMGTKTFLLTDRIPHIESLMTDKEHCVLYDSLDDMVAKARQYLSDDEARERIAENGYRHVMSNHTISHRVMKILDTIIKV